MRECERWRDPRNRTPINIKNYKFSLGEYVFTSHERYWINQGRYFWEVDPPYLRGKAGAGRR